VRSSCDLINESLRTRSTFSSSVCSALELAPRSAAVWRCVFKSLASLSEFASNRRSPARAQESCLAPARPACAMMAPAAANHRASPAAMAIAGRNESAVLARIFPRIRLTCWLISARAARPMRMAPPSALAGTGTTERTRRRVPCRADARTGLAPERLHQLRGASGDFHSFSSGVGRSEATSTLPSRLAPVMRPPGCPRHGPRVPSSRRPASGSESARHPPLVRQLLPQVLDGRCPGATCVAK